jgi:hypothetical protein
MLSVTPGHPRERKKHHGAIRSVILAYSHVLSFFTGGSTPRGIQRLANFCFCKNK